jgi:hypothetical protein
VKARVDVETIATIRSIKLDTKRTIADIFTLVLASTCAHPDWYDEPIKPECGRIMAFRIPRGIAADLLDMAWLRSSKRINYLGYAASEFFKRYRSDIVKAFLGKQLDRAVQLLGVKKDDNTTGGAGSNRTQIPGGMHKNAVHKTPEHG